MLSPQELRTVDELLGGSEPKARSELQPTTAAWSVFELLGCCSDHSHLKHIIRDEEVMTKLMTALELDAKGAAVAQFCGYVGCELAARHPDRLASFLASPANADCMVSVLSPRLAIPEVSRLFEICAEDLAPKHHAIKHFLHKLLTAVFARAPGPLLRLPDDIRLLCIFIVSKALDGLLNKTQEHECIRTIIKSVREMPNVPPSVLTAVAELCLRRKLDNDSASTCLQKAEQLFVKKTLSASCPDGSPEVRCLRMVIMLLGRYEKDLRVDGLHMPAALLCLSELAVKSIEVARRSGVLSSELDKAARDAAVLLASSVGTRWPREEVSQCASFKTREWHEGCKWLENSARYPSFHMPEHGKSVLQIQAALAPPERPTPPPPPPAARPTPVAAPAPRSPLPPLTPKSPPPPARQEPPPRRSGPSVDGQTFDPLNPSTLPPARGQTGGSPPTRPGNGGSGPPGAGAARDAVPAGRPSHSPQKQRPSPRRPEERRVLPGKTESNSGEGFLQKAWNSTTKVVSGFFGF